MNFVQTFWTSPSIIKSDDPVNRFNGGFPTEKYHAMSWAYSFHSLKKFHPDIKIILHTDSNGLEWLVNKIGIPYDEVELSLDKFCEYPQALWALSKIHTYSLQKEPFLHIDGDIYLWAPFPAKLLDKRIIADSIEIITLDNQVYNTMYTSLLEDARKNMKNIPSFFNKIMEQPNLLAFCAGLMGGSDLDLIYNYTKVAFDFVDSNIEMFKRYEKPGEYNMFIEQWFLAIMSLKKYNLGDEIGMLFYEEPPLPLFGLVPQFQKYVHMGHLKKDKLFLSHLEEKFKFDFPNISNHINSIFPYSKLFYLNCSRKQYPNDLKHTVRELQKISGINELEDNSIRDDIETLLENNFDNPEYFNLWDLYQIESHHLDVNVLLKVEENKNWNILYFTSVASFLNIPFVLNSSICQIIYLYNEWELKIENLENSTYSLIKKSANKSVLSPWIITTTFDYCDIMRLSGWNKLLLYFENQVALSGEEIIKIIKESDLFEYDEKKLDYNVYSFLTLQYFVYNRLEIVNS